MNGPYDAVMLLVTHSDYFNGYPQNLLGSLKEGGIFFDLKSLMDRKAVEREGYRYLAL